MTFPHPISSNLNFISTEYPLKKRKGSFTYQFIIRLIKSTEAEKIMIHLDFSSQIDKEHSLLFLSFNKFDLEISIEKNMRIKPPEKIKGTIIHTITMEFIIKNDLSFNCQVFSLELNPYSY